MRFFLISDNVDTLVGMRLAGISGKLVHEREEIFAAIEEAMHTEDIGVILITDKIVAQYQDEIYTMKLNIARPLIVAVPDRHGESMATEAIAAYVREAVGVKI